MVSPHELTESEQRELERKCRQATLDALSLLGGEGDREAIRDRAVPAAGFTKRELNAPGPGGRSLVEDRLAWALGRLMSLQLIENPRPGIWRLAETPYARSLRSRRHEERGQPSHVHASRGHLRVVV
jgi:hypothetical protein